eukprot:scaffold79605_cov22-Prasinocladus_malaysianus.AAC.1
MAPKAPVFYKPGVTPVSRLNLAANLIMTRWSQGRGTTTSRPGSWRALRLPWAARMSSRPGLSEPRTRSPAQTVC